MKRVIAIVAALAAACGGTTGGGTGSSSKPITADEARSAIPSQEQSKITTPQSASLTAETVGDGQALTSGSGAYLAGVTLGLSTAVNVGVAAPLVLVHSIAELEPTSCEGATCTWGPGSSQLDPNEFELTVTKVDDHYDWALSGRAKSSAASEFTKFLYGSAWPSDVRWVGHGNFTADLDAAAAALAHPFGDSSVGKIVVSNYDNRNGTQVSVQFFGMADSSDAGHHVNAAYQFQSNSDGGDLQVATRTVDTTAAVSLTLHSRWKPTGEGRGDANLNGGSGGFTQSECWGTAAASFVLLYQASTPAQAGDAGDEASCAFAPAELPAIAAP